MTMLGMTNDIHGLMESDDCGSRGLRHPDLENPTQGNPARTMSTAQPSSALTIPAMLLTSSRRRGARHISDHRSQSCWTCTLLSQYSKGLQTSCHCETTNPL
jgi:hypothetical protein